MAYLSKEQYSRRNENAAKRMVENAKNIALTEEQHEALAELCSARHDLHSNKRQVIIDDYNNYKQNIVYANIKLLESGLIPMYFVGTDESDYIDIDSFSEFELQDDENFDDEYFRISEELEDLNSKIEAYLSEIDKTYNTNYAPTGAQRIF